MSEPTSYSPKTEVRYLDRPSVIVRAVSVSTVLVRDKESGETKIAHIADLRAPDPDGPAPIRAVDGLAEDDLAEARRRLEIIHPVLATKRGRMKLYAETAEKHHLASSTVRRWVDLYESRGLLSDLAPARKGRAMPGQLDPKIEEIIQATIEEYHLTKQSQSGRKTIEEVERRCRLRKLPPPHANTIRKRLNAVEEKVRVARRQGRKAAENRFDPVLGHFPRADFPLAVVQIDHTKLDIEIVDDESRQPIGRPWLTAAIDVYSRMITGFYISLEAPSAFSVGMCLSQSILRKESELDRLGVKGEWPVWGKMRRLHADNGKDFRSATLKKACDQYGIDIEWRPVKTPHYGGHIERLMGTIAKEIHSLPGTTFSNIREKGEYDSAKSAVLTLEQLTRCFAEFVVNEYHRKKHRGIGMAPLEKWQRGILGDGRRKGTGLPPPIADPRRLYLDFLPFTERTVQSEGIVWDGIYYYCEAIRPWISAKRGGRTELFVVRRDPRDIGSIHFFDPKIKDYIEVPYFDADRPSVSLWEFRAAKQGMAGGANETEGVDAIFESIERRRQIVDEATKSTRKTRREQQRRKHASEQLALRPMPVASPNAPGSKVIHVAFSAPRVEEEDFDIPDLDPNAGVEEW